jgi:hypothetical protein
MRGPTFCPAAVGSYFPALKRAAAEWLGLSRLQRGSRTGNSGQEYGSNGKDGTI